MGLNKVYENEDVRYCVVEYDCDEDGPYNHKEIFTTIEEAIEYMDDSINPCQLYELKEVCR